jgi:hypothetical protein
MNTTTVDYDETSGIVSITQDERLLFQVTKSLIEDLQKIHVLSIDEIVDTMIFVAKIENKIEMNEADVSIALTNYLK